MALPADDISPSWLADVRDLASEHTFISPGMIYRRLRIPSAGGEALLTQLEREGLVGPRLAGSSREVLEREPQEVRLPRSLAHGAPGEVHRLLLLHSVEVAGKGPYMAAYFYATVTYRSGEKVRLVHKGREPTKATMALLGKIGAIFEIGEPLPQEKVEQYMDASTAIAIGRRAGWHPQMDIPGADDD